MFFTMRNEDISHRALNQKRNIKLQTRFLIGLATILLFFSAIASTVIYFYEINALEEEAFQKAELVMTAMEANRSYVRDILRPKMYSILDDDEFYIEAMSSSYISRSIMERFSKKIPDFTYRRVAINARNPHYEALDREREMISYFSENPAIDEWHGIVDHNKNKYFMRFKPVYFEESCSNCHGVPQNAPTQIIERYGDKRGFDHSPGEVFGLISVGLPVDLNLTQIKEIALIAFFGVIPSLLILYGIISIFFNRFIVQNIQTVLNIFRDNLKDEQDLKLLDKSQTMDEIGELTGVAIKMSDKLRENRNQLEVYASEMMLSKELLQSVFDGITDPVVLIGSGSKIQSVNRAFLQRYNLVMDQVLNRKLSDLLTAKNCLLLLCDDIITDLPIEPINREVQTQDGDVFLIYFHPIHDDFGNSKSMVCYVKDITEQKKLEVNIQQTEKIVSMGQLAAGVAHEINNPLGVILCHLDLIKDDTTITKETQEDLQIIEKHADNCKNIVADLLDFARQQKSYKEDFSVNALIEDVVAMSKNQLQTQNIELHLDLSTNLPLICINVDKIKQVVLNMIINSIHAIEKEGNIYIVTSQDPYTDNILIRFEDDGPGIPEDIKKKIFDPFFTTKPSGQGTGLGLSVSYGIIKDHDGEIRVESSTSNRTRFTISLPVHTSKHS